VAYGVHHTRIHEDLNLTREDLGLDRAEYDVDEIWAEILTPVGERDRNMLKCVAHAHGGECKAEASGVKSPYMSVRKQRGSDGTLRYIAAHLPTGVEATREEKDKHKATKGFIERTCAKAGLEYAVEKTTKTRTRRPDVTVLGDGGLDQGIEAQFWNASPGNVRARSRDHAEAGLCANWITDNDTFHLVDRANYIIIPRYTWRQIDHAADIAAISGARVLVEWRCTADGSNGRPCPDGLVYGAARGVADVGCGKIHLQWETPRLVDGGADDYGTMASFTVGRIIIGAATGDMDSLFIPERKDRRSGRYLWVPAADKKTWLEYRGGEELPEDDEDDQDDEVKFSHREISETCRYGEEGFKPSAPLPRRGLSSLGLTMTVDAPKEPAGSADSGPDDNEDPEPASGPEDDAKPAQCPGCGRPTSHRNLSGLQLHYAGCLAMTPKRAA
jgi:hypothetical protein